MKVIFLDVDNVLNDYDTRERIEEYVFVSDKHILQLKEIVDRTGAKIVLSSTWRRGWYCLEHVTEPTDADRKDIRLFQALRAKLKEFNLEMIGYTEEFGRRGDEIDKWLKMWDGEEVENFVILDDFDGKELRPHSRYLVQTSFFNGLTDGNVRKAIKILNNIGNIGDDYQRKHLKYYRVCRVKCKRCGDVLEHVNRTKKPQSHRMMTCSCGKVQLDPHVFAYRIIGFPDDYKDLSEVWPEKLDCYIWKAKNQCGLTDEQVNYFLYRCADWTLLPEYSKHCRTFGSERALEIIKEEHGVSLEWVENSPERKELYDF